MLRVKVQGYGQSVLVGNVWQQEHQILGHMAFTVRKQRKTVDGQLAVFHSVQDPSWYNGAARG